MPHPPMTASTNTISIKDWRALRHGRACESLCQAQLHGGPAHTCPPGECVKAAADQAVDKVRANRPRVTGSVEIISSAGAPRSAPGLALDSGEFVPAEQLNSAHTTAPTHRGSLPPPRGLPNISPAALQGLPHHGAPTDDDPLSPASVRAALARLGVAFALVALGAALGLYLSRLG